MKSILTIFATSKFRKSVLASVGGAFGLSLFALSPIYANEQQRGRETGLPLPRFVSLKAKTVNMRVGPGRKYAIKWQFQKRGLPVEVIQEFDQWRRIRDADGSSGWVLHSLLSSRRTAIIAPRQKPKIEFGKPVVEVMFDGKKSASKDARTKARVQAGLMVNIEECAKKWCKLEVQSTQFWLPQEKLWGVYLGEELES